MEHGVADGRFNRTRTKGRSQGLAPGFTVAADPRHRVSVLLGNAPNAADTKAAANAKARAAAEGARAEADRLTYPYQVADPTPVEPADPEPKQEEADELE